MQSIKDIKQLFEQAEKEQWNALFPQYKTDERAGVQKLITQYENKLLKHKKEQERLYRMLEFERKYGDEFSCICGIDEAGRGPFAAPSAASTAAPATPGWNKEREAAVFPVPPGWLSPAEARCAGWR